MRAALMKPWTARPVTAGETTLLAGVFGDALNTSKIRLWCCPPSGWWLKRVFCAGGMALPGRSLIVYPPQAALVDYTAPDTPLSATATFVHECTHAAQSQAGVNLLLGKLKAGDTADSYRYTLAPNTRWPDLNIEQQAMVVEHAFLAARGKATPYPLVAYRDICPYPLAAV